MGFFLCRNSSHFFRLTVISQTNLIFNDGFQYVGTAFIAITVPLGSIFFFKRQWMLSRKFGYITPGEMYYDYYKSDTIRVLSVLVTFFIAIPAYSSFFWSNWLFNKYFKRRLCL
ncbi:MAG: hypothetical protein CM1200mP13_00920 [Candidatus Pelagibacterales bacterium]|nr:MAG: hypothetical protein CM1200mP13_00920 [Pelagibacterales bacterium]